MRINLRALDKSVALKSLRNCQEQQNSTISIKVAVDSKAVNEAHSPAPKAGKSLYLNKLKPVWRIWFRWNVMASSG
jgi:hypothetical protein